MSILKIIGIAAGIAAVGLTGLTIANPGNVAETSPNAADENLKTRRYKVDFETFIEETKNLIPTLSTYGQNWKLNGGAYGSGGKSSQPENQHRSSTILVAVPVLFFTDDLEINAVKEAEKDEVIVNIRSASRVGKSDLGENKRHVLQILSALDQKFGKGFNRSVSR